MIEFDTTRPGSKKAGYDITASRIVSSNPGSQIRSSRQALLPRRARCRGIALIWTAIVLFVLILFVGLSLDMAKAFLAAHQLQNAADAAALAGAQFVKTESDTSIRDRAYNLAYANYYVDGSSVLLDKNEDNLDDGDIVIGVYYPQYDLFSPSASGEFANAVKVVARCTGSSNPPVSLNFGPIVNIHTADVSRFAIATQSGGTGAGLLALACSSPGLRIDGGSIIDVSSGPVKGEIQVDCDSCDHPKPAVSQSSNSTIIAAQMNVVGCYDGPETDYPIEDQTNDPMGDPLGCYPDYDCLIPPPPYDEANDLSPAPGVPWSPDPCVSVNILSPGYYSGGIEMTGGNVVLQPGIYVLDGEIGETPAVVGGLNINGGNVCAKRVMFYIKGGKVDIAGNPIMTLTELVQWSEADEPVTDNDFCDESFSYPPEVTNDTLLTYEGMLIYQDPDNTTPARIIGTSDWILEGTIYFPFNHVEIGGGGYAVGTQLIANSILVHTNPTEGIRINYDGRNRAPGSGSYLVK